MRAPPAAAAAASCSFRTGECATLPVFRPTSSLMAAEAWPASAIQARAGASQTTTCSHSAIIFAVRVARGNFPGRRCATAIWDKRPTALRAGANPVWQNSFAVRAGKCATGATAAQPLCGCSGRRGRCSVLAAGWTGGNGPDPPACPRALRTAPRAWPGGVLFVMPADVNAPYSPTARPCPGHYFAHGNDPALAVYRSRCPQVSTRSVAPVLVFPGRRIHVADAQFSGQEDSICTLGCHS